MENHVNEKKLSAIIMKLVWLSLLLAIYPAENLTSAGNSSPAERSTLFLSGAFYHQPGGVLLKWTAPGDNGYTGQAQGYDLRYQSCFLGPIDTEEKWQFSIQAVGEPIPSAAENVDSMIIDGLVPGEKYYFCIKAYDIAGNFSPPSNSPLEIAGDTANCAYIPGDIDFDGRLGPLDVTCLINFLYRYGPPPTPLEAGDTNGSGIIQMDDITILINFMYRCGPQPVCNIILPGQSGQ